MARRIAAVRGDQRRIGVRQAPHRQHRRDDRLEDHARPPAAAAPAARGSPGPRAASPSRAEIERHAARALLDHRLRERREPRRRLLGRRAARVDVGDHVAVAVGLAELRARTPRTPTARRRCRAPAARRAGSSRPSRPTSWPISSSSQTRANRAATGVPDREPARRARRAPPRRGAACPSRRTPPPTARRRRSAARRRRAGTATAPTSSDASSSRRPRSGRSRNSRCDVTRASAPARSPFASAQPSGSSAPTAACATASSAWNCSTTSVA